MSRWFASLYIVLLPTPHMEIHPEFDHLHGRFETQRSWTIDDIVHRRIMGTEIVVVVFEPRRPVLRERPFDATARGPAGAYAQSFEIERQTEPGPAVERSDDAILVAGPGDAALGIEQPVIGRIADPGGQRRHEIGFHANKGRVRRTVRKRHQAAAR